MFQSLNFDENDDKCNVVDDKEGGENNDEHPVDADEVAERDIDNYGCEDQVKLNDYDTKSNTIYIEEMLKK